MAVADPISDADVGPYVTQDLKLQPDGSTALVPITFARRSVPAFGFSESVLRLPP